MPQRVVFLDVDGTLTNHHGVVPESARRAVAEARGRGHLVLLSTGRSRVELFDDITSVGFDGVIASAGGYIEVGGQTLFHALMSRDQVARVVGHLDSRDIDYYLEAEEALIASRGCKRHLEGIIDRLLTERPEAREQVEQGLQPFVDSLVEGVDLLRDDVNKVSFLHSDTPIEMIIREFAGELTVTPRTVPMFGPNSGELSLPEVDKGTAARRVLQHLGIDREHSFAYGDGLNDLEMLECVGHGIAMGDAADAVKAVASDVTGTPDEDGLLTSFRRYGLV